MENEKILKKTSQKRNFYTLKDGANVYFYALLFPLAIGLILGYITIAIAKGTGFKCAEDANVLNELMNAGYFGVTLLFTMLTQIVFVVTYFCYHKANRIKFSASGVSFKKANIWTALLCALAGIMFCFGFIWLIEGCFGKLFDVLGISSSSVPFPLDNVGWLFVNLLLLGVVPAIVEELLFRGVIFKGLRNYYSAVASIILCGVLFALIHQNIMQFVYPFVLGCILSFVMEKTGNLLYPILIHMFNNFTTIILSFLMNIGVLEITFNVTWWGCICAVLVAAATVAILWLIYRFYLKKQEKIEEKPEGELVQSPPAMAGKIPVSLITSVLIAIVIIVINAL
ncbi:MAG: CPBP family intramembrane metalloprotease [Clostridia bacterium]|nr:CPBP family intramembrane metalloprotease [Clostridia bacterium]